MGSHQHSSRHDSARSRSSRSGHSHHHHRKGPIRVLKHNIKKQLRKHTWLGPTVIVAVIILIAVGFWMFHTVQTTRGKRLTAGNQVNVGSSYRDIVYKGKEYRYNSLITTVLYAGLDSKGELKPHNLYGMASPADSISLIVMDEFNKKMTIIAINRNTIARYNKYTIGGTPRGTFKDQLCLAYSYGEGGVISCQNLVGAVSDLMYGIPIKQYVISNLSSLPEIAKAIGDVTVTVPNNDLADRGYIEGNTAVINADNLEMFVRSRDIGVDFSVLGRMERQRAYINAATGKLMDLFKNKTSEMWRLLESLEYCVQTNITRSQYIDLTNALAKTAYNEQDYYSPEGKMVIGSKYEEFYTDEEKLLEKIIDIFYVEK